MKRRQPAGIEPAHHYDCSGVGRSRDRGHRHVACGGGLVRKPDQARVGHYPERRGVLDCLVVRRHDLRERPSYLCRHSSADRHSGTRTRVGRRRLRHQRLAHVPDAGRQALAGRHRPTDRCRQERGLPDPRPARIGSIGPRVRAHHCDDCLHLHDRVGGARVDRRFRRETARRRDLRDRHAQRRRPGWHRGKDQAERRAVVGGRRPGRAHDDHRRERADRLCRRYVHSPGVRTPRSRS